MEVNRFLNLLDQQLKKFTPPQIGVISLLLLFLIGVFDYMAGTDVSLSILYLVPIGMGAWYNGRQSGVLISILSATINRLEDLIAGVAMHRPWLTIWNIFLNLGFMLAFAYLLVFLQSRLEIEHRLARMDALTEIYNRRAFMEKLEYLLELAAREGWPVTLIYVDVDDFKQVNDKQGHAEGDKVLRLIASRLSTSVRHTDIVGRLGGDEFALILPHTDRHTAERLVENLHRGLSDAMENSALSATCSIGGVTLHTPISAESALKEADQLMYQAKQRGKRQIVFAEFGAQAQHCPSK